MDRFDSLSAFVAVADLKGFAAGARKLGLSASAVTRLVAALEDRLGLRLLQRTTRSVTLTDAGARYLERARRILADLEEADGAAQAERGTPVGRFVVSAPLVFGRMHVAPLMGAYLKLYPEVVGELRLSDRMANLVEDGVDLAVRIGNLPDSSLIARPIGETRRVVIAAPGYIEENGEPTDPRELASHKIIQFTGLGGSNDWRFVRGGQDERTTIVPHYLTNSADAAIFHARLGGGLAMVFAYQVAQELHDGQLKIVLRQFEPPAPPIQLVYPAARLLSAKVRTFIDMALERTDWRFGDF
ncbi:LysR family transcriptional regulator [Methylocapsa sp. S129]|uniref:LysR family transcriptional regulator n=1 Tax=Methylocapsa sp. S129 TaxID=1641869 RepID=UPI00131B60BC|nr:LysR family transcriptional regulator [Methylocapsa sp. S129]